MAEKYGFVQWCINVVEMVGFDSSDCAGKFVCTKTKIWLFDRLFAGVLTELDTNNLRSSDLAKAQRKRALDI